MRIAAFGLAMVLVLGCDHEDVTDPLPDVIDGSEGFGFRRVMDNGVVNNGFEFNGIRWNGIRWNGIRWNGIRWNGVELNGSTAVLDVAYDSDRGALAGRDEDDERVELAPNDELRAEGDLDDGETVVALETRVSEIEPFTGGSHEFQFQRVQTRVLPNGEWQDACQDGAGNPVKAILLKGDWVAPTYDRDTGAGADLATTWACRGAALAKCVEWGYHPEGSYNGTPLTNHHEACTRMVRADYCGDGEHHTENGTPIDIQDSLGINTHEGSWGIEAAWGPNGALCVNQPRKTYWSRSTAIERCSSLPSCDANGNGLHDDVAYWVSHGALFVTRNQPAALLTTPPAPSDSGG